MSGQQISEHMKILEDDKIEGEDPRDIKKPIKQEADGSYQLHDQVLHFKGGIKRYIHNVKYIWENEMTHLVTEDGMEYVINKENLLFIERRIKLGNDQL